MSVFHTAHQWCDGILRGTRILFLEGGNYRDLTFTHTRMAANYIPGVLVLYQGGFGRL